MGKKQNKKRNKNKCKDNPSDTKDEISDQQPVSSGANYAAGRNISAPDDTMEKGNSKLVPVKSNSKKKGKAKDSRIFGNSSDPDSETGEDLCVPSPPKTKDIRDEILSHLNQMQRDNLNMCARYESDADQMKARPKSSAGKTTTAGQSSRKQSYLVTKFGKLKAQNKRTLSEESSTDIPSCEKIGNLEINAPSPVKSSSKALRINIANTSRPTDKQCARKEMSLQPNSVISRAPVAIIKPNTPTVQPTSGKFCRVDSSVSSSAAQLINMNAYEILKNRLSKQVDVVKGTDLPTPSQRKRFKSNDHQTCEPTRLCASNTKEIGDGNINDIFRRGVPKFNSEHKYIRDLWLMIQKPLPLFEDLWKSYENPEQVLKARLQCPPDTDSSSQTETKARNPSVSIEAENEDEPDLLPPEVETRKQDLSKTEFPESTSSLSTASNIESIEIDKISNPDYESDLSEENDSDNVPADFRATSSESDEPNSSDQQNPYLSSSLLSKKTDTESETEPPNDPDYQPMSLSKADSSNSSNATFITVSEPDLCESFSNLSLGEITIEDLKDSPKNPTESDPVSTTPSGHCPKSEVGEKSPISKEEETRRMEVIVGKLNRKLYYQNLINQKVMDSIEQAGEQMLKFIYLSPPESYLSGLRDYVNETEYISSEFVQLKRICDKVIGNIEYPKYFTSEDHRKNEYDKQAVLLLKKNRIGEIFTNLLNEYYRVFIKLLASRRPYRSNV